jgi:hypothetical protein
MDMSVYGTNISNMELKMKYNQFKAIGLQRTGTNWLNQLVFDNFEVDRASHFWKHLTPLGVKQDDPIYNHAQYDSKHLTIHDDCLYIVTYKDFDVWRESIKRKPVDFHKTHNTKTESPLEEVYNVWMDWANSQSHKENFYMKNYVDWLQNWKTYLLEVQEIAGWERKSDNWLEPKIVHVSGPASRFDKSRYIKE